MGWSGPEVFAGPDAALIALVLHTVRPEPLLLPGTSWETLSALLPPTPPTQRKFPGLLGENSVQANMSPLLVPAQGLSF